MSSKFVNILINPLLIKHWLGLHFTSLRPVLSEHLDEETINEICNETISSEVAAIRLHEQVLLAIDDSLYLAILSYCQNKQEQLSNLWNTMSIDLDRDKKDRNNGLSINQIKMFLSKGSYFIDLFTNSLNKSEISLLLKRHCPQEQQLPSGDSLYKMLLKQKKKQFYEEVCELIRKKRDNYKTCFEFMSKRDVVQDEDEDEVTVPEDNVTQKEQLAIKSQLAEMKTIVESLIHKFTVVDSCDLDINLMEQCQTLEKMIDQLVSRTNHQFDCNSLLLKQNKKLQEQLIVQEKQFRILHEKTLKIVSDNNKKMRQLLATTVKQEQQIQMVQHEKVQIKKEKKQKIINVVELMTDNKYSIQVFDRENVLELKTKFATVSGISVKEQKLVFNKKVMKNDEEILQNIGVTHNCSIFCIKIKPSPAVATIIDDKDNYFHFEILPSDSVLSLKKKFFAATRIPVSNIRFLHKDVIMKNEKCLCDYEITDDAVISCFYGTF